MLRFLILSGALALASPAQAFDVGGFLGGLFGGKEAPEQSSPRNLEWEDLTPPLSAEAQAAIAKLNVAIDTMSDEEIQRTLDIINETGGDLISDFDSETVSIAGYLVPMDFEATEAKAFVLVPYFGACIHVPPPPPNQIVFVEYESGIPMEEIERDLYTPFRVTGTLTANRLQTDLAEVGYSLTATRVEPDGS